MSNTDKLQEDFKEETLELAHTSAMGDNAELLIERVELLLSQLEQAQETIKEYEEFTQIESNLFLDKILKVKRLTAENEQLKAVLDETETFIQNISSFRGQNLEVANWHMNGDLEPFDNFLEDNGIDDIMVKIDKTLRARQVLSEVKGND